MRCGTPINWDTNFRTSNVLLHLYHFRNYGVLKARWQVRSECLTRFYDGVMLEKFQKWFIKWQISSCRIHDVFAYEGDMGCNKSDGQIWILIRARHSLFFRCVSYQKCVENIKIPQSIIWEWWKWKFLIEQKVIPWKVQLL